MFNTLFMSPAKLMPEMVRAHTAHQNRIIMYGIEITLRLKIGFRWCRGDDGIGSWDSFLCASVCLANGIRHFVYGDLMVGLDAVKQAADCLADYPLKAIAFYFLLDEMSCESIK
jgi:hypothetical protein